MIVVIFGGIFLYLLFATKISSKSAVPSLADNYFVSNTKKVSNNKYVEDIKNISIQHHINPAILFGIVAAEQGTTNPTEWNAAAYNPADPSGAFGLTQILGSTAASFNIAPSILQESASAALETTVKYINKYSPEPNSIAATAAVYNGGPNISEEEFGNIRLQTRINKYINKATNGYNYYNQTYGSN